MKKISKQSFSLFFSIFIFFSSTSFTDSLSSSFPVSVDLPITSQTSPSSFIPSLPHITAKSYILMDADSGAVLAQRSADQKRPPASLTKLMTLYVTLQAITQEQLHLKDKVLISRNAWHASGSRMFLKPGSQVMVEQLIKGIIVASGNDASIALAEHLAGNEKRFIALMNQAAQSLGMKNTHFSNSTGLPSDDHYSSAYDLAILTRAIINHFPLYYSWYKQKWITYNKIRQPNRNRLLWRDPSVDGLKTGHTDSAGYCLIASALRNNMRLITVVMDAPSDARRTVDTETLLNWGYQFYRTYQLFKADTPVTQARVYLGNHKKIALGLTHDLYVTVPTRQYKALQWQIKISSPPLRAPLIRNQPYGQINVYLKNHLIANTPLVALQDVTKGGFLSRTIDHIALLFS